LAGNSLKRETLARPGSAPASVSAGVEIVATTTSEPGSTAPKKIAVAFAPRLMPAMPPAATPWGRTCEAPKWSSCASEVTNTRSSESGPWATPTTSSPGFSATTSNS
jgi:hypothetical protein